MLTLSTIFHIIISECENGCTDASATMAYFKKHHAGIYDSGELGVLVQCLNFDSIRRNAPLIQFN